MFLHRRHPNRIYSDGWGVVFFFLILWGMYSMYQHTLLTFCMPVTAQEYDDDLYREKAEDIAEKHLAKVQRLSWQQAGFRTDEDGARTATIKRLETKGTVAERTRYQGGGVYDVRTGTETVLTAHAPDGRKQQEVMRVQQVYIVRVHMHPQRRWYGTVDMGWQVEDVQLVEISPNIEKVNDKIAHWPMLAATNGNW